MFYKGSLRVPNITRKRFTIKNFTSSMDGSIDDSIKSPVIPAISFNFNPADGTLKGAEGIKPLKINDVLATFSGGVYPLKVYFYKRIDDNLRLNDDRIICYCNDSYLYYCNLNSINPKFYKISNSYFYSTPISVNYNYYGKDVIIFASKNDSLAVLDGTAITRYENAPSISSMCIHKERLFATSVYDINTVWFSDSFDPANWNVSLSDAGYVTIPDERGKMLKVLSFHDYVYLFREYGITRIYAYGEQTEFSVDNLYLKHGKIIGNSIAYCGNYVVFLATDGLYRFDGINLVKILSEYDNYFEGVDNSNSEGVYFDNKLYLNCNLKIKDKIENYILVYDFNTKSSYLLKDLNVTSLLSVNSEKYTLLGVNSNNNLIEFDSSGCIDDEPLKKRWENAKSDYGISNKNKRLYKFTIETNAKIKLTINCDNKKYYYNLTSNNNEVEMDIRGKYFSFEITSKSKGVKISVPTLYFSYIKENL